GVTQRHIWRKPHRLQQLLHARTNSVPWPPFDPRNQTDVSLHGEMREQANLLDDVSDAATQANHVTFPVGHSFHAYLSRRGRQQTIDQLERCSLARSAASQ